MIIVLRFLPHKMHLLYRSGLYFFKFTLVALAPLRTSKRTNFFRQLRISCNLSISLCPLASLLLLVQSGHDMLKNCEGINNSRHPGSIVIVSVALNLSKMLRSWPDCSYSHSYGSLLKCKFQLAIAPSYSENSHQAFYIEVTN